MPKRLDHPEECPFIEHHTACPSGFVEWQEWAWKMAKTHKQVLCPECGFYAIWIPKSTDSPRRVISSPDKVNLDSIVIQYPDMVLDPDPKETL